MAVKGVSHPGHVAERHFFLFVRAGTQIFNRVGEKVVGIVVVMHTQRCVMVDKLPGIRGFTQFARDPNIGRVTSVR